MPTQPMSDLGGLSDQALHERIQQTLLELGPTSADNPTLRESLVELDAERMRRRNAAMEQMLFNGGFADTAPRLRTRERPDEDEYELVPAHEEIGPGGRMDYIFQHWRRKRRTRARTPDSPALAPADGTDLPAPGADFDPLDWQRERRLIHLHALARERGEPYEPQGDLADDDTYAREMARLGYAPDPDETSLSGWVDTPPDQPDWDWLGEMDPIDRLYLAIDQLIASGELGEDFWDALPDPHAFVLGLLAIVILQFVPGIDLILDAYLAYMLGSGFIDLLDALSAISTARTPRDFERAKAAFGRALASISIDAILAVAMWGLKKWGSAPKGPRSKPRLPKGLKGLQELTPEQARRINGGSGGRNLGPGGYNGPRRLKPFEAPKAPGPGYYGEPAPRYPEGTRPEPRRDIGRTGRETRIVELADDPNVPEWIREHIRRQIRENPRGDFKLPKKGDIGPDGRPLKEDYVLGHEEHTRDPFTGRITKEGRPARENNPYGGTRPISEGLNKFEEAMRQRLEGRYAAYLENLFNRLRRLISQKRWSDVRRLLREMIDKGDIKFENLPPELQELLAR